MADSNVGNDAPQVATTTIDRISGLPDEMIHHILSFLALKNAVGTSILSNRWRHFWTFNPNLDFRQDFPKDIAIINHYIHLHNRPNIDILAIRLEAEEDLSTHVEAWIRFASTRGARKLFLDIYSDFTMDLPDVFYHHTAVTEFQLCCFTINLPLEFKGFPFLKVLTLCKVKISDQNVSDLLSTCPLEELGMSLCLDLVNLNISAPNNNLGLKFLLVWWCDHLENLVVDAPNLLGIVFQGKITTNISVVSAPRLHIADVKVTGVFSPADVGEWKPFVRTMTHVNSLRVQSWFFQFVFTEFCVLRTLETMFANLYEFRWSGFLVSRYEVLALATFLGNCPVLKTLKITCCPIFESLPGSYHRYLRVMEELTGPLEGAVTSHFRTEDKKPYLQHLDYVLPQLKAIEFVSFSGTKKEMDLVRFLLGKAPVLDSLVFTSISDNKTDSHTPNWKLQKKLDCLPKASVLAKIVFS